MFGGDSAPLESLTADLGPLRLAGLRLPGAIG
jgi:hypothetical protein